MKLTDIAAAGYFVVRTYAFNDVSETPSSGPYFQVRISYFTFHDFHLLSSSGSERRRGEYQ